MYCSQCGSQNADGASFCEKCGAAFAQSREKTMQGSEKKQGSGIEMEGDNGSGIFTDPGLELNDQAKKGVGTNMTLMTSHYANAFGLNDRIINTVTFDADCLKIETRPKKKNPCPVLYYKDITSVTFTKKWFPINIIIAVLSGIALIAGGVATAGLTAIAGVGLIALLIFIWKNTQINIFTRNGGKIVLYSNSKTTAEEFLAVLSQFAELKNDAGN